MVDKRWWKIISVIMMVLALLCMTAIALAKPPMQEPVEEKSVDIKEKVSVNPEANSPNALENIGPMAEQASSVIPVQGQLTDKDGNPITGSQTIMLTLHDQAVAGTTVCTYSKSVDITKGFFNTKFELSTTACNKKKPTEIINGSKLYLGITVGTDNQMTPRQELYPVPMAFSLIPGSRIEGTIDSGQTMYVRNGSIEKGSSAIIGYANQSSGETYGLYGFNFSSSGQAVRGYAGAKSGPAYGIYGTSLSVDGRAVFGFSQATTGKTTGVYGESVSSEGNGVRGLADSITGTTYGVSGKSFSNEGTGVFGLASSITGTTYGVYGQSDSEYGYGVYGHATYVSKTVNYGVYGQSDSSVGYGVYGTAPTTGTVGIATAISGTTYGVYGKSQADNGYGLYGYATYVTKTVNYGVYGQSDSPAGYGVYGTAPTTGTVGIATAISGTTYGVYGQSDSADGAGIHGQNNAGGVGVVAQSAMGNPLEAYGNIVTETVFQVSNGGNVYAKEGYSCGGTVSDTVKTAPCLQANTPANFSEMLPANDGLEAGDVLVIDAEGKLGRSDTAYQPTVIGVYANQPGYLGSGQFLGQNGYVPLAVVGIVLVKASAENGAIQPGDLLVASATPGYAMKAKDAPNGTIIGKALASLSEGKSSIKMLVMLQ